jgi:hypothetical protein
MLKIMASSPQKTSEMILRHMRIAEPLRALCPDRDRNSTPRAQFTAGDRAAAPFAGCASRPAIPRVFNFPYYIQ